MCGVTKMVENLLKLSREYEWSPGIKQDYEIIGNENNKVGEISIIRFSVLQPVKTHWLYLSKIEILKTERGKGWGYKTIQQLNKLLEEEERNGVLKNRTKRNEVSKNYYQQLGWEKIESVGGPWEFKIIKPISLFTARNVVENIVKNNFTK